MAFTNFETKEINCKIFYFGPRGAGKTANLRSLFAKTSPELRAGLFELDETGPTQFFDFLPLSMGYVRDFHLKLHLYAIGSHHLYETVLPVLFKGLDGFVFVNDSSLDSVGESIRCYQETRQLLLDENINIADLPHVVQYNKRDCSNPAPIPALRPELNPLGMPEFEAVATLGTGTMETLRAMAKLVLNELSMTPR